MDSPYGPWAAALSPGIDHLGGVSAGIDHLGLWIYVQIHGSMAIWIYGHMAMLEV